MRILLINQFYPPDLAATGQLLADVAETLAEGGHEVHVLCSQGAYDGGCIEQGSARPKANLERSSIPEQDNRDSQSRTQTANQVRVHRVAGTAFGHTTLRGQILDYASFYVRATQYVLRMPKVDVCVALTTPPFVGLLGLLPKVLRVYPIRPRFADNS